MSVIHPVANLIMSHPGEGNLDVRAYVAAIVGPHRVAHGAKTRATLRPDRETQLTSSAGQALRVVYTAVSLPADVAGPLVAMFSNGGAIGPQTSVPCRLLNTLGAHAGNSYSAVLLPGEDLYAQAVSATFDVFVSTVWF